MEADGKKADEGTSQDYPMARYGRSYDPCLYMHFYKDCLCLLVSYANYKKVALLVYVVVNFLSRLIFIFALFWGMVMYANEFEIKEKQKLTKIKN